MDYFTLVLLSVALAMDCFAVSLVRGNGLDRWRWWPLSLMALSFGFFQGAMPLIGYTVGYMFYDVIEKYDHWVAFALLAFIGGRMVVEDLRSRSDEEVVEERGYTFRRVLLLSVATSIDALATGLLFLPYASRLYAGVTLIALVSFLMSLLGCALGYVVGRRLNFKFGAMGGLILVAIGVKILLEHLFFS